MIKKQPQYTAGAGLSPVYYFEKAKEENISHKTSKVDRKFSLPLCPQRKVVLTQIKLVCRHYVDFIPVDENFICLINC
jgi:transcription elongation factor Elf1